MLRSLLGHILDGWTWIVKRIACGKYHSASTSQDPNHNGDHQDNNGSINDPEAPGNHVQVNTLIKCFKLISKEQSVTPSTTLLTNLFKILQTLS